MSGYRVTLFVLAGMFTAAMTSVASAGCCGWGVQAPIAYGPVAPPTAAAVYAQPVGPVAPAVAVGAWGGGWGGWGWRGGCGCHRAFVYAAAPAVQVVPIASAPIYVVNQGPDYTGPGIVVPYHTWAPGGAYMGPGAYPYFPGYGGGYGVGGGFGYYGPGPGYGPRRPLAVYGSRVYRQPYHHGGARAYAYQPHN